MINKMIVNALGENYLDDIEMIERVLWKEVGIIVGGHEPFESGRNATIEYKKSIESAIKTVRRVKAIAGIE